MHIIVCIDSESSFMMCSLLSCLASIHTYMIVLVSFQLLSFLPMLRDLLGHDLIVIRHMISRCFASMMNVDVDGVMNVSLLCIYC